MTVLMTIENLLQYLSNIYYNNYKNYVELQILKDSVEKNISLASNNKNNVKELEIYCQNNSKLIKNTEKNIPHTILPNGTLLDLKVNPGGGRNKSDDDVYKKFESLRDQIPRGLTILKINDDEKDICIYANKKFFDDDEKIYNNCKIISMEKLNGDAVHFSCRYLFNKFYLFVGSKTNHIVISQKSDIELYTGEKYAVVRKFAEIVYDTLAKLSQRNSEAFLSLLHYTKITAVCELLQHDYQHIVDIGGNNTDDKLAFLTFTSTYGNKSFTAFPPDITLKLIDCFEVFDRATYTVVDNKKYHISTLRDKTNREGQVLYYVNNFNETIAMTKVKTIWYRCLRALREKATFYLNLKKKKKNSPEDTVIDSINKKYEEMQNWLKLTDFETTNWKNEAKSFVFWLKENKQDLQAEELRKSFPNIWDEYLKKS